MCDDVIDREKCQKCFDCAEGISEALHNLEGIEIALIHTIDGPEIASSPSKAQMYFGLLSSIAHFRKSGQDLAECIARTVSGRQQ